MSDMMPEPGDIIFCHSNGTVGALIRFGERIRNSRKDLPTTYWNHVAITVEPEDGLPRVVMAGSHGVEYAYLKDIDAHYEIVPTQAFVGTANAPVNRWRVVAQAHELVGAKYGWLTIMSIVINLLTPRWFRFPDFRRGATYICSAAAAWCLHAGGAQIVTQDVYQIMPSELRALACVGSGSDD